VANGELQIFENDNNKNQIYIHQVIKNRLNSENACYYSIQSAFSSRFLSENFKTGMQKSIILSPVLCGCDTLFLTLKEGQRLREIRVLKTKFCEEYFDVRRMMWQEVRENCIMRIFITFTIHQILG
jgi:hypothetical protein